MAAQQLAAASTEGYCLADAAAELIDTIAKLIDVLSRETAFLNEQKVMEIGPLQSEKTRLTRVYQTVLQTIRALSSAGQPMEPSLKDAIFARGKVLAEAVASNERALRSAKVATERVLESIVGVLRNKSTASSVYSPRKMLSTGRGGASGVTLDRSF